MDTSNEINVDTFPKNEINQEEVKEEIPLEQDKEHEKEKLEEETPLSANQLEVIELHNEKLQKKCKDKIKKNSNLLIILFFVLLILSVFLYFFLKFRKEYTQLIDVNNQTPNKNIEVQANVEQKPLNLTNNATENNETTKTTEAEAVKSSENKKKDSNITNIEKGAKVIKDVNSVNNTNVDQAKNINLKKNKNTIGFLFPTITPFMVSNGEYLLKTNKYDVVFLTKESSPKDLTFNKNIKRINAYYNHNLVQNACKNENIDYLIVNDEFSKNEIKWMKSLGVKVIGVIDDALVPKKKKRTLASKDAELFDAFIQERPEDYIDLKKSNNNLYIPKIITFESKPSNLNLNVTNIVLKTELNDENNGLTSIINALPLIIKDVPNAKLNIISSDKPKKEINQLIQKSNLKNNIDFIPLDEKYLNIYNTSSIFIYGSLTGVCPKSLNEAKAYGLPCIISSKAKSDANLNSGIIKVDISNSNNLAKEVIKLLKDNAYRKKMENEAKLGLEKYNEETVKLWEKLFISLKNGEKDFQKLRKEVEGQYSIKATENKATENKATENKATENKATENKATENKTTKNKTNENKTTENKTTKNKTTENKTTENKTDKNKKNVKGKKK